MVVVRRKIHRKPRLMKRGSDVTLEENGNGIPGKFL
jgi:hypothetical protein